MAQIYATLIKRGLKEINDVPSVIRDEVQAILDEEDN